MEKIAIGGVTSFRISSKYLGSVRGIYKLGNTYFVDVDLAYVAGIDNLVPEDVNGNDDNVIAAIKNPLQAAPALRKIEEYLRKNEGV